MKTFLSILESFFENTIRTPLERRGVLWTTLAWLLALFGLALIGAVHYAESRGTPVAGALFWFALLFWAFAMTHTKKKPPAKPIRRRRRR